MPKKTIGRLAYRFPKKLIDLRYVSNLSVPQFPCLKSEGTKLGQRSKTGDIWFMDPWMWDFFLGGGERETS